MSPIKTVAACVLVGLSLSGCQSPMYGDEIWKAQLADNMALMGARNWVVVAESSFPAYTGTGVVTLLATRPSDVVFEQVLDTIETEGHVQPRIMVCSELRSIAEDYAPGIKKYRNQVYKMLPGRIHYELPSRIINGQIEDAAKQFNVLVIKTTTALPYSNIYIELDSGYWNSESEAALRSKIEHRQPGKQPSIIPGFGPSSNDPDPGTLPTLPTSPSNNQPTQSKEKSAQPPSQPVAVPESLPKPEFTGSQSGAVA